MFSVFSTVLGTWEPELEWRWGMLGGFVQARNGNFGGNGNLALSRLLALLSGSFPRT